jgi:chemotaxis protein histidine kinase CheA
MRQRRRKVTANIEAFQHLLQGMRESFLDELPERCDRIEHLILAVEKAPTNRDAFDELYRNIHSLKGSGGTHAVGVITAICHQLETFLTEVANEKKLGEAFANRALAYVDLIRKVDAPARSETPDYSAVEQGLETLRQSALQSRKAGLVAESSTMMVRIYEAALAPLPVQLSVVNNGLAALELLTREAFDFAIIGGELQNLNGAGVIAAIQASSGINHDLPFMLVTSKSDGIPAGVRPKTVLARDQKLSQNLAVAVQALL